jgi:hypothetical protein
MGKKDLTKSTRPEERQNGWRIRKNKELQYQYRSVNIVTAIEVRRLEWAGYVVRTEGERMMNTVFLGKAGGRRKPGRPKLRWFDCFEDDLKTLLVMRWRKKAEDHEERAIVLKEATVKL